MTVKELIEKLQEQNPHAKVVTKLVGNDDRTFDVLMVGDESDDEKSLVAVYLF